MSPTQQPEVHLSCMEQTPAIHPAVLHEAASSRPPAAVSPAMLPLLRAPQEALRRVLNQILRSVVGSVF
eukprot:12914453-Prorocentrum_lima.AAC.1